MFDLINGLPLHPLVVHAVVVLLPLAALGTIAIALRPRWRRAYGPPVVAAAALSTALLPVATTSGEALEQRVGDPGQHAALGEQLIWFAIPLLVLSLLLVWLDRRVGSGGSGRVGRRSRALSTVCALAVVSALACTVQVVRVGDSGAQAVWNDVAPVASRADGD